VSKGLIDSDQSLTLFSFDYSFVVNNFLMTNEGELYYTDRTRWEIILSFDVCESFLITAE